MSILIVDDSSDIRSCLKDVLHNAGFEDLLFAESARDAYKQLGMDGSPRDSCDIDLILMEFVMPDINGIEVCKGIKKVESLRDIPIIMIKAKSEDWSLKSAFESGVIDYIAKPFDKVELVVRVTSALKLKHETDQRKDALRRLKEANRKLQILSSRDGLTGISNRRNFDSFLNSEWKRNQREGRPLSLIMADIDFFKKYNDGYGHLAGDDCLKQVAKTLADEIFRPGDLIARYGGEEFVVVLGNTDKSAASAIAERLCAKVEARKIDHAYSTVSNVITLSLGVSTVVPKKGLSPGKLIEAADKALYEAKQDGRNRVRVSA